MSTDVWEDKTAWTPEVAGIEDTVDLELRQMLHEYNDDAPLSRKRHRKGAKLEALRKLGALRLGNSPRMTVRLGIIMRMLDKAKFESLAHFLCALFSDKASSLKNRCGRFFKQGGFVKVLKLWFADLRAWESDAKSVVIESVIEWLLEEIKALERTKLLQRQAKNHEPDFMDQYNFRRLHTIYEKQCPILAKLVGKTMSQIWVPKVSQEDVPKEVESEVSDSEKDEESMSETEILRRRKRGEGTKKRWLIKTTVISLILYGRSNRLNAFQSVVGYYLHAEGVHRGCIETCHSAGISVSYPFIRRCEIANAEASMKIALHRINTKKQPFLISWDNINRMMRVAMERMHSKSHMENWTTVAIIFLDDTGVDLMGPGFPVEWINMEIRNSLTGWDFVLDEDAIKSWPQNCKASIGKVLVKWFHNIPQKKRVVDGVHREWEPAKAVERYPLKLKKTDAQVSFCICVSCIGVFDT